MEFIEVVRGFNRLCSHPENRPYEEFPLRGSMQGFQDYFAMMTQLAFNEPEMFERFIVQWLTDHPEPMRLCKLGEQPE